MEPLGSGLCALPVSRPGGWPGMEWVPKAGGGGMGGGGRREQRGEALPAARPQIGQRGNRPALRQSWAARGTLGTAAERHEPPGHTSHRQELRGSTHKLSERRPRPDGQLAKPWSLCQAQHTETGPGRWAAGWGDVGTPLVTTNHGPCSQLANGTLEGRPPEKVREAVNTPQNKYCRGVSHTHTPPVHPPPPPEAGKAWLQRCSDSLGNRDRGPGLFTSWGAFTWVKTSI